ncbi:hypothetical protein [Segetibacter koreensis]|uniref:hypothetical protein n=1 Tax=Segetibacter koreensis TaxID=398037 RepID=UPI00036D06CA|nr:hypothetical protein [Segetibacter koreensis]
MKTLYIILFIGFCLNGYSQVHHSVYSKTKTFKSNNEAKKAHNSIADTSTATQLRETVTEQYVNGRSDKNSDADTGESNTVTKSPFVGGIHAAADAQQKFDTTSKNIHNINNIANVRDANATATPVDAANDTIFNVNTITDNGVLTNSGAVDKSGNAQFGQTNWGKSRRTVGESEWTVPPPITASFRKEFPNAANAAWSRNSKDTSIYSARYKAGDTWITTNYNASGQRMDMRTEVPLVLLPQAVSTYVSKLPSNLQVTTISRWQVLGKADVYEIHTKGGKTMYVNEEGAEVNY